MHRMHVFVRSEPGVAVWVNESEASPKFRQKKIEFIDPKLSYEANVSEVAKLVSAGARYEDFGPAVG